MASCWRARIVQAARPSQGTDRRSWTSLPLSRRSCPRLSLDLSRLTWPIIHVSISATGSFTQPTDTSVLDHMEGLSEEYRQLQETELKKFGDCVIRLRVKSNLFSSVPCKLMENTPLGPSYWTRNLTSP